MLRLGGFYFFYFALLGALLPFWGLYLDSLHFSIETIGYLIALIQFSRIFAPYLWGVLADKTGQGLLVIRLGAFLTCVAFSLIFFQETALGIALVTLLFSFFWNAVLPQFEVITLRHLAEERLYYSRVRLWGSIGFILSVLVLGALFDSVEIAWLPWILWGLMLCIWINSLWVSVPPLLHKKEEAESKEDSLSVSDILKRTEVKVFFLVCFLVQFGHGAYYSFFSILMESLQYSRAQIGLLWALGVVAEVVLFICMHWLLARYGLRRVMLVSLLFCVLRWSIIAFLPDQLGLMVIAQLMHAATFGALHSVGIALVYHYFTDSTQGRGQALFSSIGFGAGGALGAAISGMVWARCGSEITFLIPILVSVVAFVFAWIWIRPEKYT